MERTFRSAVHGWASNGIGTIILGNMSDYALGSQRVSVITSAGENVWGMRSEIFTTIPAFDLTSKAISVPFRVVSGFASLEQARVLAGPTGSRPSRLEAVARPTPQHRQAPHCSMSQEREID